MAIDYAKIFISHVRNVSKANKWFTEGEAVPTYRSGSVLSSCCDLTLFWLSTENAFPLLGSLFSDVMQLLIFLRPVTAGHLSK